MFKFPIGTVVKPMLQTSTKIKYSVVERWLQECHGGSQVWYDCRMFSQENSILHEGSGWSVAALTNTMAGTTVVAPLQRLREDELVEWVEPE